ncbi:MAG TPA: choice-of-anchor tandem repeat GloVer-containing protein [Chitinophagales bacterium]|nr:choice-of-anchor tandem repeat GloVer-containing protein [Chitinophagales bacterium]
MKIKHLLSCIVLFISTRVVAQIAQIWGTTEYGGAYNGGTLFSMNADGSNFNIAHSFNYPAGYGPRGNLFMASDGNLYGTCFYGGAYLSCTIYRYNPVSGDYNDVYCFQGMEGDYPTSGVVETNGTLYGATSLGGLNDAGVIYSFNISTGVYSDLYDMIWSGGYYDVCTPLIASDGKLYGPIAYGGADGVGALYSFDLTGNIYSVMHDFDTLNGALPYGSLIQATDGKLYGMTMFGGINNVGIIFSFDPSDNSYEKLHDFDGANGGQPMGALAQGSNGTIYGLTTGGGSNNKGVIFSLDLTNNIYTKLFDFSYTDGSVPVGNLMQTGNILCGTTFEGGANSNGTVFNFNLLTNTYNKLLDFDGTNGSQPNCGLISLGEVTSGVQTPAVNEFTVYPNPVTQYANCKASSFNNQKVIITVTDLSGKEIFSQQLMMRNSQLKIDLGNLTSGIYFLELMAGDRKKMAKVVKE